MIKANTKRLIMDFIWGTETWYKRILLQSLYYGEGNKGVEEPCILCGCTPSKMKELSDALKEIK